MLNMQKRKIVYLCVFVLVFIIICVGISKYYGDRKDGFVIGGNRLILTLEKDKDTLFLHITKKIITSGAYQGIVNIAVSPLIDDGVDLPLGFEMFISNYQINFSNSKNELFTIEFPYWNRDYIVLFQAGTEQVHRRIFYPSFFRQLQNK